ncbi:hypothetical protein INT45_011701 [Circinella minor]|uniref:Uncharacterized protein n=1 Tax=Circinella minor TaxID=1195481 RepID=A0A8H7SB34_9FUNG|nr:hypothetical protein INT45_011701 [Circinella minor]
MSDNTELYIHQDSGQGYWAKTGRRFQHSNMGTGQKECCPYTSRQCSAKPDKSNTCSFSFTYSRNGGQDRGPGFTTTCPAGGYIVATGTFDHFSYSVFDADHNRLGGHEARP